MTPGALTVSAWVCWLQLALLHAVPTFWMPSSLAERPTLGHSCFGPPKAGLRHGGERFHGWGFKSEGPRSGMPLFGDLGSEHISLETVEVIQTPEVIHMRFRVVK